MRLAALLKALPSYELHFPTPEPAEVTGLSFDSRRIEPGMLFAALPGQAVDGHRFLEQAVSKGALAALVTRPDPQLQNLCQIQVSDTRRDLARLAHEFYGRPSLNLDCIGVTGTNGKTTITYLLEAMLAPQGPVGVIGTVEARLGAKRRPAAMTTPESVDLQGFTAEVAAAGGDRVVMEVSSHALEQHRVDFVAFEAALFTNLSRDHLDFHGSMEAYFEAKSRLFLELLPWSRKMGKRALAVICADCDWGKKLAGLSRDAGLEVITYGFDASAKVRAADAELSLQGGAFNLNWQNRAFALHTSLVGKYNLVNVLGAAALALALGIPPEQIQKATANLQGVPGRLQRIGSHLPGPAVFVDYAHTPDALKQVLSVLRPLCQGRIICVFGAGGDRDTGKRPLMGQAVGAGADLALLTSDNPRTEDPLAIMDMVEPGLRQEGLSRQKGLAQAPPGSYVYDPDRARAIGQAVSAAQPEDVVLIAGKGHEDYQIIGTKRLHFDDREQAAAALAARQGQCSGESCAQAGC
ncbi:MAG: UDP-N-acetylmuramoyl-L-alanyl-D-glutamate--2,6-diaminopimelate ligase [Desulfarculaceae bacterium]|jgi:UDP-N-acetylmuramoyl-L-alanyl-D-glutamate--2,6-diaminopimelate ligase